MAYKTQKVKEKYIPKSARLLDQVREILGYHHDVIRTKKTYIRWIVYFTKFSGTRHTSGIATSIR